MPTDERTTLPVWVQAGLQAVRDHGVPAVMLAVMVYMFMGMFAGDLRGMRADMAAHSTQMLIDANVAASQVTAIKGSIESVNADLKRHLDHDVAALQALQIICVSVAADEQSRRDCLKTP